MGIFSNPKNIVFGSKAMKGAANAKGMQNSQAMKELLSNKKVSKILDKKSEQMEFYKALKEKESGGGVTKDEVRQVLGKFRKGGGKNIDKNETMGLADELIGKGMFVKRYLFERESGVAPAKSAAVPSAAKTPTGNMAPLIANKIASIQNVPGEPSVNLASDIGSALAGNDHQPIDDLKEELSNLGQDAVMPAMEDEPKKKNIVLGLIGEKGGGKGTVAGYIMGKFAASHYEVSKILTKVLENLHIEQTRENYGMLAVVLKEGFGSPVLINALLLEMEKDDSPVIIADGIRMYGDVDPFRKKYGKNFHLIYVTADVHVRYERTKARGEKAGESNATFEQFMEEENGPTEKAIRDIGKGADFRLVNNGTQEELNQQIEMMMDKIMGKKDEVS